MVGARFLTVGVGSYRLAREEAKWSMWQWISVGDIRINSYLAYYRHILLHIVIFIDMCMCVYMCIYTQFIYIYFGSVNRA